MLFNGIALFQISKQKPNSTIRKQKVETTLLIVSIFDFFVELIYIIHQGVMYKLVADDDIMGPLFDTFYLQVPWISDLNCFSRPFLLVFICKQVRVSLFAMFRKEKPLKSVVIPSTMISKELSINVIKEFPEMRFQSNRQLTTRGSI